MNGDARRASTGIFRTLVMMPSWLGDCVMATPAIRALAAPASGCRVTLAIPRAFTGAFESLCEVECVPRPRTMIEAFGMRGAREPFDVAIVLPNSTSSAIRAKLAFRPRAMVGRRSIARTAVLTHPVRVAPDLDALPTVDLYCALAEAWLGTTIEDRAPWLPVTAQDRAGARTAIGSRDEGCRGTVVLNPGASREGKRWPAGRFHEIARRLSSRGWHVAASGAPSERELCDEVLGELPHATNLAAEGLGLGALRAVLADAALLVTNDTGTRHVAAAVGCPWVCVFGSEPPSLSRLPASRGVELVPPDARVTSIGIEDAWDAIERMVDGAGR
jgi:heptosyltransferase-2